MEIPQKNIKNKLNFRQLAGLAAILLLSLILYWPVAGFGWVTGMDQQLLIDNRLVYNFSFSRVMDIFFSSVAGRYQPITFLSYSIDIAILPGSAIRTIHIVNLLLHFLNVILFFRLMQLLSKQSTLIITASLLFAIHPMNMEAIGWISSRSILLCTFFFLLALLIYVYHGTTRRKGWKYPVVFLFLMAMLSNPVAVIFPLALILLDHLQGKKLKESLNGKTFMILLSLLFMVITPLFAAGSDTQAISPNTGESILLIFSSIGMLSAKFFIPLNLAGWHPIPGGLDFFYLWLPALIPVLVLAVLWFFRKEKAFLVGILFFVAGLVSALLLLQDPGALYHEHDAYLPYLGIYGLAGLFFSRLWLYLRKTKYMQLIVVLPAMAWVGWLGWTSSERLPDWKSSERIWTRVIELYPHDAQAYYFRGDHWAMNGEFERAKFDYNQCIRFNPDAYQALNNLGLIYLEENEPRLALEKFTQAIEINENFFKSHLNRGLTYMRMGVTDLAMEEMDRAITLNPDEPLAYYNRGLIFERDNFLEEAIAEFSKAINLDPYRRIFYKDRGKAYVFKQNFFSAEIDYSKALELDPSDPEMWFRRSLVRVSQNNFEGGLKDALMAQKLGFPVTEDYIKGLTVQILEADSVILK